MRSLLLFPLVIIGTTALPQSGTTTDSVTPTTTTSAPCTTTTQWEYHFDQCGGVGWAGPTNCSPDFDCILLNPYYGQCGKIVVTCP